jgi:hypothetical protein
VVDSSGEDGNGCGEALPLGPHLTPVLTTRLMTQIDKWACALWSHMSVTHWEPARCFVAF